VSVEDTVEQDCSFDA